MSTTLTYKINNPLARCLMLEQTIAGAVNDIFDWAEANNLQPPAICNVRNEKNAVPHFDVWFATEEDAAAFILADIMPSDSERVG